jgi:hypothetical protein
VSQRICPSHEDTAYRPGVPQDGHCRKPGLAHARDAGPAGFRLSVAVNLYFAAIPDAVAAALDRLLAGALLPRQVGVVAWRRPGKGSPPIFADARRGMPPDRHASMIACHGASQGRPLGEGAHLGLTPPSNPINIRDRGVCEFSRTRPGL